MADKENNNFNCDHETGACEPVTLEGNKENHEEQTQNAEIIYIGDPMCSWCWGISPALKQLQASYKPKGVPLRTVVGGLRPGGGDAWDENMKNFLRHHWEEVHERSGQPFGYSLFEKENFNYDTEPSCRAVVAARPFLGNGELAFFEAIQQKFYVDNEDPNPPEFYRSICEQFDINFEEFLKNFQSQEVKKATFDEFRLNRSWGVKGYPTVVLRKEDHLYLVTRGYATFEEMDQQIAPLLASDLVKNPD